MPFYNAFHKTTFLKAIFRNQGYFHFTLLLPRCLNQSTLFKLGCGQFNLLCGCTTVGLNFCFRFIKEGISGLQTHSIEIATFLLGGR